MDDAFEDVIPEGSAGILQQCLLRTSSLVGDLRAVLEVSVYPLCAGLSRDYHRWHCLQLPGGIIEWAHKAFVEVRHLHHI
jgi:hypothetical protein